MHSEDTVLAHAADVYASLKGQDGRSGLFLAFVAGAQWQAAEDAMRLSAAAKERDVLATQLWTAIDALGAVINAHAYGDTLYQRMGVEDPRARIARAALAKLHASL